MRTSLLFSALLALATVTTAPTWAQGTPASTGAVPVQTDVTGVVTGSPEHTALAGALASAGLVETLQGDGPFTIFAPTDAAFAAVPADAAAMLMEPEHAEMLSGVLTYHVVAGRLSAERLTEQIKLSGGEAALTTVNGAMLTASMNDAGDVTLTDAAGNTATVTTVDLAASNGVVHVIDTVLMPETGSAME